MANLVVTFTRVEKIPGTLIPVEVGREARVERIAIDASSDGIDSAQSTLALSSGENVISLYAESDCWVKIGPDPTAAPVGVGTTGSSRFLSSGSYRSFIAQAGDKVAVCGPEDI